MCYNVLCEKYATTQMYGYCPSWALSWEYRKKVILGEIRHYTADIITLQVHFVMNSSMQKAFEPTLIIIMFCLFRTYKLGAYHGFKIYIFRHIKREYFLEKHLQPCNDFT